MLSPTKSSTSGSLTPERFAICLLLVCSLQIMENLLPKVPIFPWLRIGLAYWIVLPFLLRFGVFKTMILFLFRNLITLIYGGQIFSAFLISTSGGLISLAIVGSLVRVLYQHKHIGLLGVSVLLATSFNLLQLFIVDKLFIQHQGFYFQLSPILLWSVISGSFIAFLVYGSQNALKRLIVDPIEINGKANVTNEVSVNPVNFLYLSVSVALLVFIITFKGFEIQLLIFVALLISNRFKSVKLFLYAWPFFFYIAWLHLFKEDGVYILEDWITREGLEAFVYYTLRTGSIILCGQLIARHIPKVLSRTGNNLYLEGMSYTLPILPAIFGISIGLGKNLFTRLKKRQFKDSLDPLIEKLLFEFKSIEQK